MWKRITYVKVWNPLYYRNSSSQLVTCKLRYASVSKRDLVQNISYENEVGLKWGNITIWMVSQKEDLFQHRGKRPLGYSLFHNSHQKVALFTRRRSPVVALLVESLFLKLKSGTTETSFRCYRSSCHERSFNLPPSPKWKTIEPRENWKFDRFAPSLIHCKKITANFLGRVAKVQ